MTNNIRYLANVLIIDDSRVDSAFLAQLLESFGCHVDLCSSGYDAVQRLDKKYELVFLDINMPDLNGYEIANGLKNFGKQIYSTPLILISGEDFSREMEEKCIQLKVEGYIQKPIKKDELQMILQAFLRHYEIEMFAGHNGSHNARGFIKKVQA